MFQSFTRPLFLFLLACMFFFEPCATQAADQPFNRIAVIIDASGSFHSRQSEAVAKVGELLGGLSLRKSKRWNLPDQIDIISLDASPEVIWSGTPKDLQAVDKSEWLRRFRGRSDYAKCTDVTAALSLAVSRLSSGGPAPTATYLYIFSDLVDEPPLKGVSSCAKPRGVIGDEFDWAALQNVRVVAFWMPVDQKMAWNRAMRSHGLTSFRLLSNSESGVNAVEVPPSAKHVVTVEERQATKQSMSGFLNVVILSVAGVVALIVVIGLFSAWAARRRSHRLPSVQNGRSRIPPMRLTGKPNGDSRS